MTRQETARVLAYLTAAWPSTRITDATAELWATELANTDPQAAMVAARRIVRGDQWFPSVARFLETVRACTPPPEHLALPSAPPDYARNIDRVRGIRADLEARRALP